MKGLLENWNADAEERINEVRGEREKSIFQRVCLLTAH